MPDFTDQQLRELLANQLDNDTSRKIENQLASDPELRSRLDSLAGNKELSPFIDTVQQIPSLSPTEQTMPDSLGPYTLTREVGKGGMGIVYLAHDTALERDVAIKTISTHYSDSPKFREQFLHEARIAAKLDHPHIAPVHTVDDIDGKLFMVMKYVDGTSLEHHIDKEGSIPEEQIKTILEHVINALEYAHSQGVIHCDIKPANILLDKSGNTFLTDFGISKLILPSNSTSGTEGFRPPESGQYSVSKMGDLYALGKTVKHMMGGGNSQYSKGLIHAASSLSAQDPNQRTLQPLKDFLHGSPTKTSPLPKRLAVISLITLLAIGGGFYIKYGAHQKQPTSTTAPAPFDLAKSIQDSSPHDTIKLPSGIIQLKKPLYINKPLTLIGNKTTLRGTTDKNHMLTVSSQLTMSRLRIEDTTPSRNYAIINTVGSHARLDLKHCQISRAKTEEAYESGHPAVGLQQGATAHLSHCTISTPGSPCTGSYPGKPRTSDHLTLSHCKLDGHVCVFRARSGGLTLCVLEQCDINCHYIISINNQSGKSLIKTIGGKLHGQLLHAPVPEHIPLHKVFEFTTKDTQITPSPAFESPWLKKN